MERGETFENKLPTIISRLLALSMVSKRSGEDSGDGDAIVQKFKPRGINFEERETRKRRNVKSVIKIIVMRARK